MIFFVQLSFIVRITNFSSSWLRIVTVFIRYYTYYFLKFSNLVRAPSILKFSFSVIPFLTVLFTKKDNKKVNFLEIPVKTRFRSNNGEKRNSLLWARWCILYPIRVISTLVEALAIHTSSAIVLLSLTVVEGLGFWAEGWERSKGLIEAKARRRKGLFSLE